MTGNYSQTTESEGRSELNELGNSNEQYIFKYF